MKLIGGKRTFLPPPPPPPRPVIVFEGLGFFSETLVKIVGAEETRAVCALNTIIGFSQ